MHDKDKENMPTTACEWIDESIKRTEESARSYGKIVETISQRKIHESKTHNMTMLFELSEEQQSALRIVERLGAQARGHIDMLGMVKRDLKCNQTIINVK